MLAGWTLPSETHTLKRPYRAMLWSSLAPLICSVWQDRWPRGACLQKKYRLPLGWDPQERGEGKSAGTRGEQGSCLTGPQRSTLPGWPATPPSSSTHTSTGWGPSVGEVRAYNHDFSSFPLILRSPPRLSLDAWLQPLSLKSLHGRKVGTLPIAAWGVGEASGDEPACLPALFSLFHCSCS